MKMYNNKVKTTLTTILPLLFLSACNSGNSSSNSNIPQQASPATSPKMHNLQMSNQRLAEIKAAQRMIETQITNSASALLTQIENETLAQSPKDYMTRDKFMQFDTGLQTLTNMSNADIITHVRQYTRNPSGGFIAGFTQSSEDKLRMYAQITNETYVSGEAYVMEPNRIILDKITRRTGVCDNLSFYVYLLLKGYADFSDDQAQIYPQYISNGHVVTMIRFIDEPNQLYVVDEWLHYLNPNRYQQGFVGTLASYYQELYSVMANTSMRSDYILDLAYFTPSQANIDLRMYLGHFNDITNFVVNGGALPCPTQVNAWGNSAGLDLTRSSNENDNFKLIDTDLMGMARALGDTNQQRMHFFHTETGNRKCQIF